MFANRKLTIGAFLASLAIFTIIGQSGGPPEDTLTGQLLPLPNFPFLLRSSSSSVTSSSSSVVIDERAAEGLRDEGGFIDGCQGYERLFPKEYAGIPEGDTLVNGLWWRIFKRERDRILQGHDAKTDNAPAADCRKAERDIVMNMMQLTKLYECALTDESRNILFQTERALSAQRTGTEREPLTVLDVWNYIQSELQHIEQSMGALRSIREYVLSSAFSRCAERDSIARSRSSSSSSSLHEASDGGGGEWTDDDSQPPEGGGGGDGEENGDAGGDGTWEEPAEVLPVGDQEGGA